MNRIPVRRIPLGPRAVTVTRRSDGTVLLRAPHSLEPYPVRYTERLMHWAQVKPGQTWLAQRTAGGAWRTVTYAEGLRAVRSIGQALLDRGLSAERPLVILSENGIEHALLATAALHVGIPYAAISPAYSLVATDYGTLRHIVDRLTPGTVFVDDPGKYERAIHGAVHDSIPLVVTRDALTGYACIHIDELQRTPTTADVERAHGAIAPDAIAKLLFTSGSTGHPKGVIHTHRMLMSNQQMIVQGLPFLREAPPVLVDWLPWNHTFGGNHNFGLVLYNGGTLYIDEGRPAPGLIDITVGNLKDVAPTVYFNVPRGFDLLAPRLRADRTLREHFYSRLGMLFYAGAGLSQPVWDAYEEMAVQTIGERILWVTGLGATETAPAATFTTWDGVRAGMIGLPLPGVEVRLAPVNDKLEMRVRGDNVSSGYWRDAERTREAFDEEGFYRMGDAVRFVDPDDVLQGLFFDGRVAEDFKLSSGTWVSVGPLRTRFIAAGSPFVRDVVLTGLNRPCVGALIFPDVEACRALCQRLAPTAPANEVLADANVRARFQQIADELAREATGSSNRVERLLVLTVPPSIDALEVTDKGSINQAAVLAHRANLVEYLYSEPRAADVIAAFPG